MRNPILKLRLADTAHHTAQILYMSILAAASPLLEALPIIHITTHYAA